MLRRNVHRRAGMTLVELLVAIGIIVTLMALLVGAVMKALDVLPRTDTSARIATTSSAANTFGANNSFGGTRYPIPAGRFDKATGAWVGGFRLRNSYPAGGNPGMDSFEAQYIIEVFGVRPTSVSGGPVQINDLGWTGPSLDSIELDANQTFTFFLTGIPELNGDGTASFTGFSSDPQRPFARRTSPTETRKGPVLDLTGKQKYTLVAPDGFSNGFAWLVDGYSYRAADGTMVPGTPYAYFATYKGQRNKYGGYNPHLPAGVVPSPYKRTGAATGDYENATGFQLISAGKDRLFGTGGNWSSLTPTGMDDQSNFSTSLLGAGPQ